MITVILGPMAAGKTKTAIAWAEDDDKTVGYFKPETDNRSHGISTHDGVERSAKVIRNLEDGNKCFDYDVCVFDELQFFGEFIIQLAKELSLNGKKVIITGLNFYHDGTVPERVTQIKDRTGCKVVNLKAKCTVCGEPAEFTKKLGNKNVLIEVGGLGVYEPRCQKHFED